MDAERPVVLCLSGHDPGGGAGIQADIEAVAAMGGHAATVVTAHTVQDTNNVFRMVPADAELLQAQVDALLGDLRVRAIKIGLLGAASQVDFIAATLRRARVPVVMDPVLRAGGGAELAGAALLERIAELLPLVDVLTPNAAEARRLVPAAASLADCGAALLERGARHVLITGGDEAGDPVVNLWFERARPPRRFAWPRLPGRFHGAGCTLAAATAALLARGQRPASAIADAQAYTHRSLARAFAPGAGRSIPGRLRDD
jgi:hydroxymethylpyrimidine/phosphomethylpyrimidine kinase